jgi:hypothetical protein
MPAFGRATVPYGTGARNSGCGGSAGGSTREEVVRSDGVVLGDPTGSSNEIAPTLVVGVVAPPATG